MSQMVALPPEIVALFDGTTLAEKRHVALIVATVDADGWPHMSFLGPGELLVRDARRLAFLLWPRSATAANIARERRATLFFAAGGSVWEARVAAAMRVDGEGPTLRFDAEVVAIREHAAPYADVLGLVDYRLHDPDAVIERWNEQIQRLRHEG
jgi:hypothetical protein